MKKYRKVLLFFVLVLLALSLFLIFNRYISADMYTSCEDGLSFTNDTLVSVNNQNLCQHKYIKPVSYCYGYYSVQAETFKSSGLINSCDILEGTFPESTAKNYSQNGTIIAQRYTAEKALTLNGVYESGPCSKSPSNPDEVENYQGCVNKVFNEVDSSITSSIRAVSYDEYKFSKDSDSWNQFNSAVLDGLLKVKQARPNLSVLIAGTSSPIKSNLSSTQRNQVFDKMLSIADIYLDEHYPDERDLQSMQNNPSEIVSYYGDVLAKVPKMVGKTLVLLGVGEGQRWSTDQNPDILNDYFYDLEINQVKQLIDSKKIVGVGTFTMSLQPSRTKKFISLLYNHYIKNNQSTPLIRANSNYMTNGSFEESLQPWIIEAGSAQIKPYNPINTILYVGNPTYQLRKKIPNGNSYLSLIRSTQTNIVTQNLKLKDEALYQAEIYSKKLNNDFGSSIDIDVVDNAGVSVAVSRTSHDVYAGLSVDSSTSIEPTLENCLAGYKTCTKLKNYWKQNLVTFYGKDGLKLKITDSSAGAGDDHIVDFVQILPIGEGRIYKTLKTGFNILNIPAISDNSSVSNCARLRSLPNGNLKIFSYNPARVNWDYVPLDTNYLMKSTLAYYIYNPGGEVALELVYDNYSCPQNKTVIKKGWNLISNATGTVKSIDDLVSWVELACEEESCLEFAPLSKYIAGKAYRYVFAIEDAAATDPGKAFRKIDLNLNNSDRSIKAGQAFWIYFNN